MRPRSSNLDAALTASHSRRLIVDVFHGSDRVMQDLELTDWEIEGDLTRDVKFSGSARLVHQSMSGESLVPVGTGGILSPFRARLLIMQEIAVGNFTERVMIGWARIVTAPKGKDYWADTRFGRYVVASDVEFDFLGLEENVRRRGFRKPEEPPSLTSTYAELRRITGMTVVTTVADQPVPAGTVYDTSRGGRLKGTQELFDSIDAIGVINPAGQWVGLPKVPGDPVGSLALGENGTVVDVGLEIDTDEVYNCVAGTFEDAERNPVYSFAEVPAGDLATTGFYGENTLQYNRTAPVANQIEADQIVQAVLSQSIGGQKYQVPVKCISNPIIELGDVLTVDGWVRPIQGRLIKYRMNQEALMDATLEVQRDFR